MAIVKYVHEEYTHDLISPREIVPLLIQLFNPASVVDIGCGIGTFLYIFKENGVSEVTGIDGSWTDKQLLAKYLTPKEYVEHDLTTSFDLKKTFDIAICLEVAEHLPAEFAPSIINNLVNHSKMIIFSAAAPCQGGQNHLNEQWPVYWEKLFNTHDYECFDIIRPLIWQNEKVQWWYRQNIFVAAHKSLGNIAPLSRLSATNKIESYVHPELLFIKQQKIDAFEKGKLSYPAYLKTIAKKLFRGR